jgi:hypothetical protein
MPFNAFTTHRPSSKTYHTTKVEPLALDGVGLRRVPDECAVAPLEIRVQALELSPYRTGLAGRHRQRLRVSLAFPACSCPLSLSTSGQLDDPEGVLRTSPGWTRDSAPRIRGARFSRTGLLSETRCRNPGYPGHRYSLQGGGLVCSGPTCPAQVSYEGSVPPSPPSPRRWLSHPPSTMG